MGAGNNLIRNTARGIRKDDKTFQAIISDDLGFGATANELDAVVSYCDMYTKIDKVENQTETSLESSVRFFTGLKKNFEETDASYLKRFMAWTHRSGDTVWGTKHNIKHIFNVYFPSAEVFVSENTDGINLMVNGDFEDPAGVEWVMVNTLITNSARFANESGASIGTEGSLKQTVSLSAGSYFLHFFMLGQLRVTIKDTGLNKYWNFTSFSWQSAISSKGFVSSTWDIQDMFFILAHTADIEISIESDTGSFVDYFRLNKKEKHPSFTLLVCFSSASLGESLFASSGNADPIDGQNYDAMSYYDSAFLSGVSGSARSIYDSLLNEVKPCGVMATLELIERSI